MSFEQLLLVFFLVVLPLLQFLGRILRQPEAPPEPAQKKPPAIPPSRKQPPPVVVEVAPVPIAPEPAPIDRPVRRPPPPARRPQLLNPRQALVHLAIIGPCRALSPYRWPESDSHG
jgi:hypothetical protein